MEAAVCPCCGAAFVVEKAIQKYNRENGISNTQSNQRPGKNANKSNIAIIIALILLVISLVVVGILLYNALNDSSDGDKSYHTTNNNTTNNNTNNNNTTNNNNNTNNNTTNNTSNDSTNNTSNDSTNNTTNNNNNTTNNNGTGNDTANRTEGALRGTYVSENGLYEINFKSDFTCTWYQDMYGYELYFNGTYEDNNGVYILHIEGGEHSYNTRFEAVPVEDGLIITGGILDESGELFVKD
jgi:hypothetical protein